MSRIVQEKFQVNYPQQHNDDAQSGWVSDTSARTKHGLQTQGKDGRFEPYHGDMLNSLPPGANLDDQEFLHSPTLRMAGCLGSGTQVVEDVTKKSLREGFDRKKLLSSDDLYTREHHDAFYDLVETEDGEEAFLERNNMLDRS